MPVPAGARPAWPHHTEPLHVPCLAPARPRHAKPRRATPRSMPCSSHAVPGHAPPCRASPIHDPCLAMPCPARPCRAAPGLATPRRSSIHASLMPGRALPRRAAPRQSTILVEIDGLSILSHLIDSPSIIICYSPDGNCFFDSANIRVALVDVIVMKSTFFLSSSSRRALSVFLAIWSPFFSARTPLLI
jgi:hypothetical protein